MIKAPPIVGEFEPNLTILIQLRYDAGKENSVYGFLSWARESIHRPKKAWYTIGEVKLGYEYGTVDLWLSSD
jgi:hypothetical protein